MMNFEDMENRTERTFVTQTDTKFQNMNDDFDGYIHQPEKKGVFYPNKFSFSRRVLMWKTRLSKRGNFNWLKKLVCSRGKSQFGSRCKTKQLEKESDSLKESYNKLKEDYDTLCKQNGKLNPTSLHVSSKNSRVTCFPEEFSWQCRTKSKAPLGSSTSSIPLTPRRADPTPTPNENPTDQYLSENEKKDLSDQEMTIKTRKEIVDLGVRLGKMNIVAWARDDEKREKGIFGNENVEAEEIEYTKHANPWEEADKSKHAVRLI